MGAPGKSSLVVKCDDCGFAARVPADLAGRKIRCKKCDEVVRVPGSKTPSRPEKVAEKPVEKKPAEKKPQPVAVAPVSAARPRAPLGFGFVRIYWLLALAFVPLAMITFQDQKRAGEDFVKRWENTIATASPETAKKVQNLLHSDATLDDVLAAIPENKIEGAYLPRGSHAHWAWAGESALLFLIVLPLLFPWASSRDSGLLLVAVFTGTFGILFLYVVQYFCLPAYGAAHDPDASIFTSMFGYTMGVGLAEELAKALPLVVFILVGKTMDWRRACLWGFASGLGFGVSEGIEYAGEMYNGLATGGIYVVRFVSCVALHAIWAASSAIVLCERQDDLRKAKSFNGLRWVLLRGLAAPMLFHGFYDTLLKHDENMLALLTAAGSFVWFASEIERLTKAEDTAFVPAGRPAFA